MFGEILAQAAGGTEQLSGIRWERPADLFSISTHWKLRDEDARALLGGMSNGSFYQLKRAPRTLDQDKLTRVSLLVGIFKALNILYSAKLADAWVQLPNSNPLFGGESPLARMLKGGVPSACWQ